MCHSVLVGHSFSDGPSEGPSDGWRLGPLPGKAEVLNNLFPICVILNEVKDLVVYAKNENWNAMTPRRAAP